MKKIVLFASMLFGGLTMSFAAETAYECDFSKGLDGFTVYDEDGKKPQTAAVQTGFNSAGDSWIEGSYMKNPLVISNSTHSPIGRAEDWLITPAITVGEGHLFQFDAISLSYSAANKVGQFTVKLSTTGVAVEDFTVELASKVSSPSQWTTFGYDLSEYAGQTVYLAIINEGLSKDILGIDNLFVGIPPIAKMEAVYTRIQKNPVRGQRISVNVTAGMGDAVTSLTAKLICGDFSTERTMTGLSIEKGKVYTFQFDEDLPAPTPGESQVFDVEVLINDVETITTSGEIITQAFQPAKRVVCEEQTGTWCGWCPRGHVYMEQMDEDYPDTYIGIASHIGDVMQNYDYANYLSGIIGGGAPSGRVQRDAASAGCDPSNFPSLYKTHINTPALADIAIYAEWVDDTHSALWLSTTTTFALNARNFETRLEYVIVEDDVNVPGNNNYDQANYYAGGSSGNMGGYESKASTVPASDMFYDDVVRGVVTDEMGSGIKGSVPTAIVKGQAYTHTVKVDVPSSVREVENCEFIVLLLDYETGLVLNAARCSEVNAPNALEGVTTDNNTRAYAANGGVRVDVNANAQVEVNIYATDGTLVYAASPRRVNGVATIDCPISGRGVYLVNVVCDGVAKTHKVVL